MELNERYSRAKLRLQVTTHLLKKINREGREEAKKK